MSDIQGTDTAPHERRLGRDVLVANAVLGLTYFAAGKLGLSFAVVNPSASPIWPASGVALAALLLRGRGLWPGLFIGAFLVNVTTSGQWIASMAIAAGNTMEGLLGAALVRRFNGPRGGFERAGEVWRFFLLAGVVSTTVAATIGTLSLALGSAPRPFGYGEVWLTWWLGDAVGVMLVAPLILLWGKDPVVRWRRREVVELVLLVATIVVVGQVLFGGALPTRLEHYPLDFLCIPVFVWVALRFGQREAISAVLILSWIALSGTLAGVGPFVGSSRSESLLLLQVFLGLASLLTLSLAAIMAEARRGHEAAARIATIVETANDAIITKTLDGTITSWNPAAEKMFGHAAGDAIGQHITIIIPEEYRHEEAMVIAKIARGEVVERFQTVRARKDGSRVDVALTVSPVLSSGGRIVGASKIVRDIGDRMRLEEARNALLARETQARADAEAGNRAKDEFLAVLSHELRTPLNAVYGWARMMQTRDLDEETSTRAVDAIVRNANAQVQLIDDLLDVSRIVNGKMRLEMRPTDVKEVIEAALDAVRPTSEAKGVGLSTVLDPRGGIVNGDPGRLQQVVWNLLINAVKFTPAGGDVEIRLERKTNGVELVVRDTGQGIPAHVLPFVFDRFRQWDSSSTRSHSGLGLGLALVKHLTEMHHGTVVAESPGEGQGATFRLTLPLAGASQRPRASTATGATLEGGGGARLDGLRILVVDDEADARALASSILGGAGATVRTCRSAPEALATVQSWRPDVLVSDIDMPGEDGYSLIRNVRALADEQGGRTPAVALTAYGRREERVRTLASGYSMHIQKPIDPDDLTATIATVARVLRPPPRMRWPESPEGQGV